MSGSPSVGRLRGIQRGSFGIVSTQFVFLAAEGPGEVKDVIPGANPARQSLLSIGAAEPSLDAPSFR